MCLTILWVGTSKVKLLLTLHGQVGEDAFLGCIMVLFKGPVQL